MDRVLFPPTAGNIVTMLKNDPEQRFSTFLKALKAAKLDQEISDYSSKKSINHKCKVDTLQSIKISAGPWTCFAPTNEAFMNVPMSELEALIKDKKKLRKLIMNHLINRSLYHSGLRSHEIVEMANGEKLNLFSRSGKLNG